MITSYTVNRTRPRQCCPSGADALSDVLQPDPTASGACWPDAWPGLLW